MELITPESDLAYLKGKTVLAVGAHADDLSIFAGGALCALARAGANVHALRVTDDYADSFDIPTEETKKVNSDQFQKSMNILGVTTVHNLDFPTDQLSSVKLVDLREKIIFKFRELKPYAVISFDPYSAYGEDNQDHLMVAKAVDESYWTSIFDKHHPEHFALGVAPHAVIERWYFGRELTRTTSSIDISEFLEQKIAAVNSHEVMMDNIYYQLTIFERDSGQKLLIEDRESLVPLMIQSMAKSAGEKSGFEFAENYRIVRFIGMEAAFEPKPGSRTWKNSPHMNGEKL